MRVFTLICFAMLYGFCSTGHTAIQEWERNARQWLPTFLKIVSERPAWASRLTVLAVVRENNERENFWLSDFRKDEAGYTALLTTQPQQLQHAKPGMRVPVQTEGIKDWHFSDSRDGKTYGHFGICADLKQLPVREAQDQKEYWQLACKP